jgi:leucyl-tRNA synthetase
LQQWFFLKTLRKSIFLTFMAITRQYPFHRIEPKWQQFWDAEQTFRAFGPGESIPAEHPFGKRHGLGGQTATAGNLPKKCYILDMFPYPSGAGLHVGHPEGYTATDILSRFRRAQGLNVLHPMGWDAFGLPAEQYAIKTGQHPRVTTVANIANFKRQIKALGFSYDWTREVDTTDVGYFHWTQWIFLQLYNAWVNPATGKAEHVSTMVIPAGEDEYEYRDARRLAYISYAPVNWCPGLGTVLANEEVIDGKSEVGGFPVERKPMRQWMFRITALADRLIDDLNLVDWTDSLKDMQRNWIGRSEGAEVRFALVGSQEQITVFTTRPDTLFGATYMVMAPEHPLVETLTTAAQREAVRAYQEATKGKSDMDRGLDKTKTGVWTGAYAVNPVNGREIPLWISDYVMMGYGTGAIMAVPAHDDRDWEFAKKFGLEIIRVVSGGEPDACSTEEGVAVNSAFLDGLPTQEAKQKMTAWLEEQGFGKKTINFKLRDWLFSRQRYWGEPFPIVWKNGKHSALAESDLPLLPPDLTDYKPTSDGQPPLARAEEWMHPAEGVIRESNTMPQWAGSCWYYLRYLDARNNQTFCSKEAEAYWMGSNGKDAGVDLYVGGAEHAVLHLLYARFWHKALFDLGHVTTPEPFHRLVNQGLILGELEVHQFVDADGELISAADLKDIGEEATPEGPVFMGTHKKTGVKVRGVRISEDLIEPSNTTLKSHPEIKVDARSFKMSKSRGNVVNPDMILDNYGADALRLYEMFMGPLEAVKPWSTKNVEGVYRFLGKVWRLCMHTEDKEANPEDPASYAVHPSVQDVEPTKEQLRVLHTAIKKTTESLEGMGFNTAISFLMIFCNEATAWKVRPVSILQTFLQLLAPLAPHLAEELWSRLHGPGSLTYLAWPQHDESLLVSDEVNITIQLNGKTKAQLTMPAGLDKAALEAAVLANAKVKELLGGAEPKKVIAVPGRLVNLVV